MNYLVQNVTSATVEKPTSIGKTGREASLGIRQLKEMSKDMRWFVARPFGEREELKELMVILENGTTSQHFPRAGEVYRNRHFIEMGSEAWSGD